MPDLHLTFAPYVHHIFVDREAVILDERNDAYVLLDIDDSALLKHALTTARVSPLVMELYRAGILECAAQPASVREFSPTIGIYGVGNHQWRHTPLHEVTTWKPASLFRSACALSASVMRLRRRGLHEALNAVRHARSTDIAAGYDWREIERLASEIKWYARRSFASAACLEFSLAMHRRLCDNGVHCTFNIGVQKYDFVAHAWIEVDGRVVADSPDLPARMPRILQI
ncbi:MULTISPECIES: lasso peptide biosynthesis B2 protein [Cupriavidus]|uniref:Lasso peptide biosynthesis B2 protein n=1 Tax=Cupriavidus pauculus TaxID=82633 RepID=A0A5P2H7Q3_9BURK|nr:lasso peptide biosynthesis B2 protein [Cupriavidus pauculus]QET04121.1 lasso peptide biosynthesis B2 protein [Cupriavidus pauculus]